MRIMSCPLPATAVASGSRTRLTAMAVAAPSPRARHTVAFAWRSHGRLFRPRHRPSIKAAPSLALAPLAAFEQSFPKASGPAAEWYFHPEPLSSYACGMRAPCLRRWAWPNPAFNADVRQAVPVERWLTPKRYAAAHSRMQSRLVRASRFSGARARGCIGHFASKQAARGCGATFSARLERAHARMSRCAPRPLRSGTASDSALRTGAVAFGPLHRGSRAEARVSSLSAVPSGAARHNPSFHATCASLRLSHARELQR